VAKRIEIKKGVHREVSGDCEVCHIEHKGKDVDLRPLDRKAFDHKEETGFALTGKHAEFGGTCERCHTTRSFMALTPACTTCHKDPHQGSMKAPCTQCHTPAGWANPERGFHKATAFPLEGRHLSVPCASCHINGQVKGTPRKCFDCHWIRRQDDRYRTRLGSQCEECHRPTAWTAVQWDHAAKTGLPLNASHRTVGCDGCHKNQTFKGTLPDCYACHSENYQGTRNPNHAAAGFPTTCEICHSPGDTSFHQAKFNHGLTYPLVGQHAARACADCHKNSVYKGTPRDCYGCHKTDYESAKDPNHVAAGFPTACDLCHRPSDASFDQGTFNHNQYFQKVGVHATQPCAACHKNNIFAGTPRNCYGCHKTDYERTQNPNHVLAGFPTTCDDCHKATDAMFAGITFNHDQFFQRVGVHATQACTACHKNSLYKGTPRDCYGCHQTKYFATSNPNHLMAGFPTTCELCHRPTDTSFTQGTFNHDQFFQRVGIHATQLCTACHKNSVYKGTSRDCFGCHQAKYLATTNPNHAAAGFPTTCELCHRPTDTSFTQGTFNHTYFPMRMGNNVCSNCHTDPLNFKAFTCVTCHTRSGTDSKHRTVVGYVYNSVNCYACHPQGRT
jgi:hypothetical protein